MRKDLMLAGFAISASLFTYNHLVFAESEVSTVLSNQAQTRSAVSINSYRVENVTDEGFDFIIKFNGEEVTYLDLPYWKMGNYNGMMTSNDRIENLGNNEFKLHIKMKDIGSGTEYVYIGVHPSTASGSYFVGDLAIKLDSVNPELSLSLSNTNWTNQDITLKAVSNDNQNIIEKLYYYDKSNNKTDYDMYSTPKILIINGHNSSEIVNSYKNKTNVTVILGSSVTSVDQLKGYDVVIYDGGWWGIDSTRADILNQAFEEGVSIITNMNDSPNSLNITSGVSATSGAYTFNNAEEDQISATNPHYSQGRLNRFAYLIDGQTESDSGFYTIKAGEGAFVISTVTISDGTKSPGVLLKTHSNGNKWIHVQSAYKILANSALDRAIDELMHGTLKTRQTYEKSFTIGENGTYTIEVEDFSGNKTKKSITVTNIDKTNPTIDVSGVPTSSTNQNITLTVNGTDNESGVKSITLPNGSIINGSSATYTVNQNGDYTFKVTDNAGNTSTKTINIDIPVLTSQDNPDENMIRLDWTLNDATEKTFKVYQKKPGSSTFQTISSTNLNNGEQVKVLNVHPNVGSQITYTTWDGEVITDVKSASLKQWMEEPNSESDKGYGKGLIEVIPVTIQDFNANPENYLLKDDEGNFIYDVVMFGTWDSNGVNYDINATSLSLIKEFVESGRGLLLGHDTLRQGTMPYFTELREYLNIEVPGDKNIASSYQSVKYSVVSDYILKKKEGLLTNYPWVIDKSKLTVPKTHSSRQWAFGDVWFEFTDIDTTTYPSYEGIIYNGLDGNGTNNFYLTTWNNTAMIQTGHSNGQATADEQKILANTLFYLNQLSSETYLDDYSGQDVSAPNTPKISGYSFTSDGYINFTFDAVTDNGSTYEYYVESTSKDINITTKSNTVSDTITSGIKGYSYVIDNNATTIPDDVIEQSSNATIKYKYSSTSNLYVHIKAIDNVGNVSETYHYKLVDNTNPAMTITQTPTTWTTGNVTITVKATDTGSGVKNITLPNGTVVNSSSTTYTVSANGSYTFKATDYYGNVTTQTVNVTNIDKEGPVISYTLTPNSWTNGNVTINLTVTDSGIGIKEIHMPNGTIISSSSTSYTVSLNGAYYFKAVDNLGNETVLPVLVNTIDVKVPSLTISNNENWTNQDVQVTITGTD